MTKGFANYFIVLILGALLGIACTYVWSEVKVIPEQKEMIKNVLSYAGNKINKENNHCSPNLNTVTDVINSIFMDGSDSYINRVRAGCNGNQCLITTSSCKPWQQSECGQRILRYTRTAGTPEKYSDFICQDLP